MISWDNVSRAILHYQKLGFQYLETPWIVSDEAIQATIPPGATASFCGDGYLVGSAEQGFVELMIQGKLGPGRYVSAGPCFRSDPVDKYHQRHFFKVELICLVSPTTAFEDIDEGVHTLARMVKEFFDEVLTPSSEDQDAIRDFQAEPTKLVKTQDGLDIELNGIELGSYGFRRFQSFEWLYGTGYADPRFSTVAGLR